MKALKEKIDVEIVETIQKMMEKHNPLFEIYKCAKEKIEEAEEKNIVQDVFIQLKQENNTKTIESRYSKPTASEIAGVLVSNEFDETDSEVTQVGSVQIA